MCRLGEVTRDVAEAAVANVTGVDDAPSGIEALTQSRPVHEVVEI